MPGEGLFRIALDAMGGDYAPLVAVKGALAAAHKGVPVDLYGNSLEITRLLDAQEEAWRDLSLRVFHASEVILMAEEPVRAVRTKEHSSLSLAVKALASGGAGAVVSAGNSGAVMVAAALFLGKSPGVLRPAIGAFLPCRTKRGVFCLDLGANVDCRPEHLVQFAQMGCGFVSERCGLQSPSVGLLCNGVEPCKGSALVREVHERLSESGMNFSGNIEPDGAIAGNVDVLVSDGFTGNLFIKSLETGALLRDAASVEGATCGGAQLLGVRGLVFIAHGSATWRDMEATLLDAHALRSCGNNVVQAALPEGEKRWM